MLKINGKVITDVVYKGKRIQRIMVGGKKYYDMYDGKIIGNALEAGSISIDGKTYSYGVGYFEISVGELKSASLNNLFANKKISTITHFGIDTRRMTDVQQMFNNCSSLTELNLHGFNTQNVTNMYRMFYGSSNLTNLDFGDKFDTQNVTSMQYMFLSCASLTSLDVSGFNTRNVTNMQAMFNNCSSLTTLNLGNEFDASKVTLVSNMFSGCSLLKTITGSIKNLSISLSLSVCPLDHDSAMRIINGLANVTDTQTLTLSSTTKGKLSAAEKAIVINKGWTLA